VPFSGTLYRSQSSGKEQGIEKFLAQTDARGDAEGNGIAMESRRDDRDHQEN
jgi:hypothetical protein